MKKVILLIVLAFSLSINAQVKNLLKTDEVLSKAVEKGIGFAEKTGNFVIEQAPDLLKEFYAWQLYSNISIVVLMLIISYVIYFVSKKVVKFMEDDFMYILNLFQILPVVFLLFSVYRIIFITVAPKLYLIEHFVK
jgi:hypothetical protein